MTGDESGGTCMNGVTLIVFFLSEPLQAKLFDLPSRQAGGNARVLAPLTDAVAHVRTR